MFLEPFDKSPCRFPYVLLTVIQLVTLVSVDEPTFLCNVIAIIWGHQEVLDGVVFFKKDLDPHLTTNILKLLLNPGVWYHSLDVVVIVVAVDGAVGGGMFVVVLGLVDVLSVVDVGLESV